MALDLFSLAGDGPAGGATPPSGAMQNAEFMAAVLPHLPRLRAAARRWANGINSDAQDFEQETLMIAYRHWPQAHAGPGFYAWLLTTLKHVVFHEFEKRGRQGKYALTDVALASVSEASYGDGPVSFRCKCGRGTDSDLGLCVACNEPFHARSVARKEKKAARKVRVTERKQVRREVWIECSRCGGRGCVGVQACAACDASGRVHRRMQILLEKGP